MKQRSDLLAFRVKDDLAAWFHPFIFPSFSNFTARSAKKRCFNHWRVKVRATFSHCIYKSSTSFCRETKHWTVRRLQDFSLLTWKHFRARGKKTPNKEELWKLRWSKWDVLLKSPSLDSYTWKMLLIISAEQRTLFELELAVVQSDAILTPHLPIALLLWNAD